MTNPTQESSTALAIPDDIRADLLKAQAGSITTLQRLPSIDILGAGAGLYEFGDTHETVSVFQGIVLNNHPRNVLWDKPMSSVPTPDGKKALPACSSNNGEYGVVREGFTHEGLPAGVVGDGKTTRVKCSDCPYNKWGTGNRFRPNANAKGKAVTNQRAMYVLIPNKQIPYRLILPPTSISPFDEYLTQLLSRNLPVQAVLTEFSQERKEKGVNRWAEARFKLVQSLTQDQFNLVMQKRAEWLQSISPSPVDLDDQPVAPAEGKGKDDIPEAEVEPVDDTGDDDLPF